MSESTNTEAIKYKLVRLPSKQLSVPELAITLNVLAKLYNKPLEHIIRKLDKVSGNIRTL
jgi:hypothetical protein